MGSHHVGGQVSRRVKNREINLLNGIVWVTKKRFKKSLRERGVSQGHALKKTVFPRGQKAG